MKVAADRSTWWKGLCSSDWSDFYLMNTEWIDLLLLSFCWVSIYTVENSSGTALPRDVYMHKNRNISPTQPHTYTYTTFLPITMKAAIILSNCAARSSLFSDAPCLHWAPFSVWEAHCAEDEPLCPHSLQMDVPFSFVFTCLNRRVGLRSAPDWPPWLPVGRETAFFAPLWTDVAFSFAHICIAGRFILVCILQWGTLDFSPWKNRVHSCICSV